MTSEQLHNVVLIEGLCLVLMLLIVISSYKRWPALFFASTLAATVSFFSVWHVLMAFGAVFTYGPASLLLWLELDKKSVGVGGAKFRTVRTVCWLFLAVGVTILILKNILNIYGYLS